MATLELTGKKILLMVVLTAVLASLVFLSGLLTGGRRKPAVEAPALPVHVVADQAAQAGDATEPGAGAGGEDPAAGAGAIDSVQQLVAEEIFAIQVGSFLLQEDADQNVLYWTDLGYEPYVQRIRDTARKQIFKVLIGRYETYREAERAAESFAMKEDRNSIVVRVRSPEQGP